MNYNQSLDYITKKLSLGIQPGLSRILSLLEKMDNPQDKIKIIHIAGTNGKGTVAFYIANSLVAKGLKVGLFTSPWIFDYREQISINGEYISKEDFARYVSAYSENDCTEFEFLCAIMYKYFADNNVDYAVVECGMGGRGDSTNVEKENVCSVLTSISLDHTDFLGNTIEEITREKEGIIRDNSPCFRYCDTGDFDYDNAFLAKRVLDFIGCDFVKSDKPPARQQRIGSILLDGGHNPQAGRALAQKIDNEVAVIGMMKDKDIDGYLSFVAPKCKKIICTDVDNKRAISAEILAEYAKKYCDDVEIIKSPSVAVGQKDVSLICGSFYLIREIINLIS